MLRFFASALTVVFLIGCSAPAPSLKMFAPNATRIPPPTTGSYSATGGYYEGPNITAPPIGTGARLDQPGDASATPPGGQTADSSPNNTQFVSRTAVTSASEPSGSSSGIRIVDGSQPTLASGSSTTTKDTSTGPAEPKPFRPPHRLIEISDLPQPQRPVRAERQPTPTRASRSAGGQTSAPKAARSNGWQPRERVRHSDRIAGR